jgi:hypothetical protein
MHIRCLLIPKEFFIVMMIEELRAGNEKARKQPISASCERHAGES